MHGATFQPLLFDSACMSRAGMSSREDHLLSSASIDDPPPPRACVRCLDLDLDLQPAWLYTHEVERQARPGHIAAPVRKLALPKLPRPRISGDACMHAVPWSQVEHSLPSLTQ